MFEIITSEATYLKSLMVLDEVFAKSEELNPDVPEKSVLTKQERHLIFSNTDQIRSTSERQVNQFHVLHVNNDGYNIEIPLACIGVHLVTTGF